MINELKSLHPNQRRILGGVEPSDLKYFTTFSAHFPMDVTTYKIIPYSNKNCYYDGLSFFLSFDLVNDGAKVLMKRISVNKNRRRRMRGRIKRRKEKKEKNKRVNIMNCALVDTLAAIFAP